MGDFRIEVDEGPVVAAIARLNAALNRPDQIHAQIAELLVKQTKERFAKGVTPFGARWVAKSLATIEAQRSREGKKRNGRMDTRPLFGPSKRLSSEILGFHDAGAAVVGSNLIYAAVQQFGAAKGAFGRTKRNAPIPWGAIPARPFIGLGRDDAEEIVTVLSAWLARVAQGNAGA